MTRAYSSRPGPPDSVGILLLIVGVLAALVLALPALLVGLLAQHAMRKQAWSTLLWLGISVVNLVLLGVLWAHGLNQAVSAQLVELFQNIQRAHLHLSRWQWGALWSRTWPLWLYSLLIVPLVALGGDLLVERTGGPTRLLVRQEEATQRRRARAHKRAERQARDPERLPDAVGEQMVLGIAMTDDETR